MAKYNEGQYVYIVENNRWIRKAGVISYSGGFYTLRIVNGGLIRLRENRLYANEEDAIKAVPPQEPPKSEIPTPSATRRTHHFYT